MDPAEASLQAGNSDNSWEAGGRRCQIYGCHVTLVTYYEKSRRICNIHRKADEVEKDGILQRFCHKCNRFHSLEDFDEGRRNCRNCLIRHKAQQRKRRRELYGGQIRHQSRRNRRQETPSVLSESTDAESRGLEEDRIDKFDSDIEQDQAPLQTTPAENIFQSPQLREKVHHYQNQNAVQCHSFAQPTQSTNDPVRRLVQLASLSNFIERALANTLFNLIGGSVPPGSPVLNLDGTRNAIANMHRNTAANNGANTNNNRVASTRDQHSAFSRLPVRSKPRPRPKFDGEDDQRRPE